MTQRKPVRPSDGLANVRYEIRGKLARRALALERLGYDIVSLNIGNPYAFGFRTPETMRLAMIENLRHSEGYVHQKGIFPAREAVVMQQQERGVRGVTAEEVFIGNGVSELIDLTLRALLNPGDEVLVFEPFYGYHVNTLKSLRVKPVLVALAEPDFTLDVDVLRAAVTPQTRAVLVNTPANPSGKIFSQSELEEVAELCRRHDLFLITDEIYEYFVYDGARHICPATLPGMRERTIVISGFSKTYSITGWRIGYATADARWMPAMAHFHDLTYVCAPAPLQVGAAAGLEQLPPSFYTQLAADYQSKRGRMTAALTDAGMEPAVPAGAYYIMASVDHLPGATAAEKARHLLKTTGVAAVAGSAFFRPGRGENLLRFCFAKQDAELDEACARLRKL